MSEPAQNKVNFGYKRVEKSKKQGMVDDVFSGVAARYDLMNDLMSAGLHRIWKKKFCDKVLNLDSKILDVASGSGDISLELARMAGKNLNLTITDINSDMLSLARDKALSQDFDCNIDFKCADAQNLPFDDNTFDYYLVSFGIRNMTDLPAVLAEAKRVLKPGGKFLCMEFSKVTPAPLRPAYKFYLKNIIPQVGRIVAGSYDSYQYLAQSIDLFPDPHHFCRMIEQAGLGNVAFERLSLGIVAIHCAFKNV